MSTRMMIFVALIFVPLARARGDEPTRAEALSSLNDACEFFHSKVAIHGGYVWMYSSDLRYRQGEGLAYDQRIWVQPPGTPAVGRAFLDAYQITKNPRHLQAARDAAQALVKGQLHSGGWYYSITFDPEKRGDYNYRIPPSKGVPNVKVDPNEPGGWDTWRQRRYKGNMTLLDDNNTQSALRLLMRVDQILEFKDAQIHEAVEYGLESVLRAQYPVGAWSHNYDRFPRKIADVEHYPIKPASFPDPWSRTWTKKFAGCYLINDRITLDVIQVMLDAHEIYGSAKYLDSAKRGGRFLLLAQMPDPQPGWAQGYDRNMQPVWDRPFEPPAITGFESQDVMLMLLRLYKKTGERKYLDAVGKGLAYYQKSLLPDGKLSRFYELKTNRPIYFTKDYKITYDRGEMPDHYQFISASRLDEIAAEFQRLSASGPNAEPPPIDRAALAEQTARVIASQDARGAWTEDGFVRDPQGRKVVPKEGIIRSDTFIHNVRTLCDFLSQSE